MKKKPLLVLALVLSMIQLSIAQKVKVLQDKVLSSAPGKELRYCNQYGIKNIYKGATNNGGGPLMGFADMGEAGFLWRDRTKVIFYTNDLEKKWEKEIDLEMNYMTADYIDMVGGENAGYVIEKGLKKTRVIKFLPDGTMLEGHIDMKEIEDICENRFYGTGVTNDYLYFLASKYVSKAKKRTYHLIKFNSKMEREITPIDLSHDEYEQAKFGTKEEGYPYLAASWIIMNSSADKVYFEKKYFKDIEGQKTLKELKISIGEYTEASKAIKYTNIEFKTDQFPYASYTLPLSNMNAEKDELVLFGSFSDDVNLKFVNGFYTIKYKLGEQKIIYSKKYLYKELIDKMKGDCKLEEKMSTVFINEYAYFMFGEADVETGCFNLTLQGPRYGVKGMSFQVRLNAEGEIVKINESSYLDSQIIYSDYTLWPTTSPTKFVAPGCPSSVYDFISDQAGKVETHFLLSKKFRRKDFYTVVYINDKDSELRAFKLALE